MKTFEDERSELLIWYKNLTGESRELPDDSGQMSMQEHLDNEEYYRRLLELKKKYNMETFADEYGELLIWYKKRTDETRKLPNDGTGLDATGQQGRQDYLDNLEYRRRLKVLMEKYDMEFDS
ncbi:MAG: hypothetical protein LBE35_00770 [Clostridiales bacterium]|jgi:hypothetical protein|nr:hypothetical protein [Clostridiales bacterium]